MLALRPGKAVGELVAIFAGVGARIVLDRAQVGLASDADAQQTDARNGQRIVGIVELFILEPAEAEFVDHAVGRDGGPGGPAILGANRRIGVAADAGAGIQNARRLQSVGGDPTQHVQAEAEGIALSRAVVDLAEAKILIGGAGNGLELASQERNRGSALGRGRRGAARAVELAAGIEQRIAGSGDIGDQREIAPHAFVVEEVE